MYDVNDPMIIAGHLYLTTIFLIFCVHSLHTSINYNNRLSLGDAHSINFSYNAAKRIITEPCKVQCEGYPMGNSVNQKRELGVNYNTKTTNQKRPLAVDQLR